MKKKITSAKELIYKALETNNINKEDNIKFVEFLINSIGRYVEAEKNRDPERKDIGVYLMYLQGLKSLMALCSGEIKLKECTC